MYPMRLNLRVAALVVVAVGAVLLAGSLTPRQTLAADTEPAGVFCAALSVSTDPNFSGTTLIRIEKDFDPGDGNPNDIAFTAMAYIQLAPGMPDCQTPNEKLPSKVNLTAPSGDRPAVFGKYTPSTNTVDVDACIEDLSFGPVPLPNWSRLIAQLSISKTAAKTAGTFEIRNPVDAMTCADNVDTNVLTIDTEGHYLDSIEDDGSVANFDSDWDGDGCRDWDELAPDSDNGSGGGRDPFNYWDFRDVPAGTPPTRDQAVFGSDISAVVSVFGETGDPTLNPVTTPLVAGTYHTAYDVSGSLSGGNVWNAAPPDGGIFGTDISAIVSQFGTSC